MQASHAVWGKFCNDSKTTFRGSSSPQKDSGSKQVDTGFSPESPSAKLELQGWQTLNKRPGKRLAIQEQQSSRKGSVQEMTVCNRYSGSSTIYTVANSLHESVNYMPSHGWKAGTLQVQLVNTNPRPVGVTNRGWLPSKFLVNRWNT